MNNLGVADVNLRVQEFEKLVLVSMLPLNRLIQRDNLPCQC